MGTNKGEKNAGTNRSVRAISQIGSKEVKDQALTNKLQHIHEQLHVY